MNRDVRMFLASLTKVNTEIALYVFGSMDVSNNLAPSAFVPEREDALGAEMMRLGQTLRERATEHRQTIEAPIIADVDPAEPSARKPPQIPEF